MIYRFERRGRRPALMVMLIAVWTVILAVWVVLDLATLAALVLVAFTLPALWDIVRDSRGVVEVWAKRIVWSSTLGKGERSDIDHVRLNRRFDGTMKITLVHIGGATTRLPPDINPPTDAFQTALKDAGIVAQRHPFSPI